MVFDLKKTNLKSTWKPFETVIMTKTVKNGFYPLPKSKTKHPFRFSNCIFRLEIADLSNDFGKQKLDKFKNYLINIHCILISNWNKQ